eukprot:9090334-Pyramimonas_sp.AAC.1
MSRQKGTRTLAIRDNGRVGRLSHSPTILLSSQLGRPAGQDAAMAKGLMDSKIGVCSSAAQMVDEACQGAPDDRGAAAVTNWLQGLACVSAGP